MEHRTQKYLSMILIVLMLGVVVVFGYYLSLRNGLRGNVTLNNKMPEQNSSDNNQKIRQPAVAGMFYPRDEEQLSGDIGKYFNEVNIKEEVDKFTPAVILVPHAGYEYSGQIAAYGYKLLEGKNIKRVILLGASHNYPVDGLVTDGSDSWKTPLGSVGLDKDLIGKLQLSVDSEPFVPEHSLEVQLPFLQKVLPEGFKIVPILVGDIDYVETQHAASQIAKYVDGNTVVIISSDMSHYPSYEDATKYDKQTINSILTGDSAKFEDAINTLERENIPNAATFMCAQPAVTLGMMLAKAINAQEIKLLKYANSGDVTGDKSRVVGYSAIGFFRKESEQNDLINIARESIETFVKNGKIPEINPTESQNDLLQQKSGVFVTLTNTGQLRGCIGLMESDEPLYKTISRMAVAAALDDPRFNPVTVEDLPKLKYEVSVLSPMRKIKDVSEIKLGKHGVKVQNNGRSGVFLPQVADETGWSKEEFLNRLCQDKAGLPADCWKDPATEVYVFTAQVFSD